SGREQQQVLPRRKVGYPVAALVGRLPDEPVVTCIPRQLVMPLATREPIYIGATDQRVVTAPTAQPTAAAAPIELVIVVVAEEDIISGHAIQEIGTTVADQAVVATIAI